MKYFTKEWYGLMQQQNYTLGLKKIPDGKYTDREVRAFYDPDAYICMTRFTERRTDMRCTFSCIRGALFGI